MMVSTIAQAEPGVELYHTNRPFTAIEFNWQGNLASDQLEGEAGRITDVVKGEPIGIFMQVGLEKETTVALGYDSGSNAWQAALEASDYVSPYGHWDKTFDNVGWTVGTKLVGTNWTAYIWSMQNGIDFYTSWNVLWPDENGMFMITNVMVGSIGDYPPMTEVWDIGPDLSPAHSNYPGDNQGVEKIYKADLTAYYQLAPAGIMITPEKTGAPVGGDAVAFTASGLTQYGVEWTMYPDMGPDGACLEPDGNVAYVWPGNMPGIYQIYAWSSAYPQFYAGAELDVIVVEIQPESFMDVGEGYMSGEFTADTDGAIGNSYNWFAELPPAYEGGDILKNPELIQTDNKANIIGYWYAYPLDNPSDVCVWYVNCNVSFDDFTCKDETDPPGRLRVTLPDEAGKTTFYYSIVDISSTNENGKYWATGITISTRVDQPVFNIPPNSPFFDKTYAHEQQHYDDYTQSSSPITLGEEYFSDSSIWARMVEKGITSKETTPCTSDDELQGMIVQCLKDEEAAFVPIAEERAYDVSDPMWPQYIYQSK